MFPQARSSLAPLCGLILLGRRIPTMAIVFVGFSVAPRGTTLTAIGMRSIINYDLSTYQSTIPRTDFAFQSAHRLPRAGEYKFQRPRPSLSSAQGKPTYFNKRISTRVEITRSG